VSRSEARRRIVAATGRLLAQRRFRELTVEAVMAEAGLARTIFYRHFEGLPDLVLALLDEAVADEAAPAAGVHDTLERTVNLFARHGHLLAAFEQASYLDADVERAYRDAFEGSVDATAALLAQYVAEPRPVARALMHLNTHYLTDALARGQEPDREEALRTLWTIWSRVLGISAPPADSSAA
jgi:AcrR family transcriptional regulator